ncbi:MAG: hypothetical protein IRZ21_01195 [Thermoleophilaceae bacterium]|nr:hypothetical protein [Thermoleophilaceae bacterium]
MPPLEDVLPGFTPENELERRVTAEPALIEGLMWGTPRPGHPEGSVAAHVQDLLDRLEQRNEPPERRALLRFVTLVHDAFKNRVQEWRPRTGENHHAMRARRFAERFTHDERLLTTIELHDRPYGIWRSWRRTGRLDTEQLERLIERLPDPELFMAFVELDGSTEGKKREPIEWFRAELTKRRGGH